MTRAALLAPLVTGARGHVSPSPATLRQRSFAAGVLPHTPEHMLRWFQDPPRIDPLTAMPSLGGSERDARHIAAYLYAPER